MKLRKGDIVQVITGKDKGAQGEIIRVLPKQNKVIVAGVNIAKKHQKPTKANTPGGIIDKDMPMDASNVMLVHKGETTRVGYKTVDNAKVRVARTNDEVIG